MYRTLSFAVVLPLGILFLSVPDLVGQTALPKTYLLNVSKDQVPSDTGMDNKTRPEIVDNIKELGGKALKVVFAKGDSFGGRANSNNNWKKYSAIRFDAFNPENSPAILELVIAHDRSTNFNTRVVVPINVKPGKNEFKIGIDTLSNVNGSAPDLAHVTRWHIGDVKRAGPTVYFGDIYFEGGDAPSGPVGGGTPVASGANPLVGYRVQGKIGSTEIDLTLTPFVVSGAGSPVTSAAPPMVHGDDARVARIRAAKMPVINHPIMFDTPEADAILSALEVFPPNNPWNLDVSNWPVHPNSKGIVASIGADKPIRYNADMSFILVPPNQKKIPVKITGYPSESDRGPFPVADNTPIENWPVGYKDKKVTLDQVQRNTLNEKGDRHAIVLDPVNRMLYEFWVMKKTDDGWQAAQGSTFDLKTNRMRPEDWTSADAAGLPIFPAVVRYDELKRGVIDHPLRITVKNSRRGYVYPARHFASRDAGENLPRMGERLRLRKDYDISAFSPELQTILKALKKYGMLVADNGIDWAVSVAPDPRIPNLHDEFRKLKGSDFEVIEAPQGYRPPE